MCTQHADDDDDDDANGNRKMNDGLDKGRGGRKIEERANIDPWPFKKLYYVR